MFPDADILGANYTPTMIDGIQQVWTQHNELAYNIRLKIGPGIPIHARPKKPEQRLHQHVIDALDYYWPELEGCGGSSGVVGALWAKNCLGYDMVVMAGIPLDSDGLVYSEQYPAPARKGVKQFARKQQVLDWAKALRRHKDQGKTGGIYSMSGQTRSILGEPNGVR